MKNDYVECPELSGKTIQKLCVYKGTGNGSEMQIDLTDGTSFSCSLSHEPIAKAIFFKGGIGTPEIIRNYDI